MVGRPLGCSFLGKHTTLPRSESSTRSLSRPGFPDCSPPKAHATLHPLRVPFVLLTCYPLHCVGTQKCTERVPRCTRGLTLSHSSLSFVSPRPAECVWDTRTSADEPNHVRSRGNGADPRGSPDSSLGWLT